MNFRPDDVESPVLLERPQDIEANRSCDQIGELQAGRVRPLVDKQGFPLEQGEVELALPPGGLVVGDPPKGQFQFAILTFASAFKDKVYQPSCLTKRDKTVKEGFHAEMESDIVRAPRICVASCEPKLVDNRRDKRNIRVLDDLVGSLDERFSLSRFDLQESEGILLSSNISLMQNELVVSCKLELQPLKMRHNAVGINVLAHKDARQNEYRKRGIRLVQNR